MLLSLQVVMLKRKEIGGESTKNIGNYRRNIMRSKDGSGNSINFRMNFRTTLKK